jgi:CTP synthase (UTP-ammonia lyase)
MIKSAHWARTNNVPYLGICLGMQLAVVEFARNVCGMAKAGSAEFNEGCEQPVVVYMPEIDKTKMGGTMRLGKRVTKFQPGTEWSRLRALYGEKQEIWERHRHRYEVNPKVTEDLEKAGLTFIGKDESGERMEILELKDHPWYVGVQFHPEYLSRVLAPSKTFLGFFAAAAGCLEEITELFKNRHDLSHEEAI